MEVDLQRVSVQLARIEENQAHGSRVLDRIEVQVRETNGRVTRHDEQIRTLFQHREDDREKRDDKRDSDAETRAMTLKDIRWWLAIAGGCIAGTWWVMTQLVGFHR